MKFKNWVAVLVIAGALGGCQSSPSASGSTAQPDANKPSESTTPETKTPEATTAETKEKLAIPASLRHEGARYLGLEMGKKMVYTVTVSGSDPSEGTVQTTPTEVTDTTAKFDRVSDGALAATGTEKLELNKDGIFVVEISNGKFDQPQLELPFDVKVGSKWVQKGSFELQGQKLTQDSKLSADAIEKVKVPAGEYEALRVKLDGSLKGDAVSAKMKATFWYSKDVGLIKVETELIPSAEGQAPAKHSMVLKRIE